MVGFADFKSVGPGPSVGAVGSTPSRSRHLVTGVEESLAVSPRGFSFVGGQVNCRQIADQTRCRVMIAVRAPTSTLGLLDFCLDSTQLSQRSGVNLIGGMYLV